MTRKLKLPCKVITIRNLDPLDTLSYSIEQRPSDSIPALRRELEDPEPPFACQGFLYLLADWLRRLLANQPHDKIRLAYLPQVCLVRRFGARRSEFKRPGNKP